GVEAGAEAADRAAAPSSAEQAVAVSRAVTDRAETRTAPAAGARAIGLSPGGPVRSRTPAPTAPPPRPPHQRDGPSGCAGRTGPGAPIPPGAGDGGRRPPA